MKVRACVCDCPHVCGTQEEGRQLGLRKQTDVVRAWKRVLKHIFAHLEKKQGLRMMLEICVVSLICGINRF
jgi:hypothetical protein